MYYRGRTSRSSIVTGRTCQSFRSLPALLLACACSQPVAEPGRFEGSWIIAEHHDIDAQGEATVVRARASQAVFGQRHYSIMWRVGSDANPPFLERWNPTDEEKVVSFDALRANAGTYDVSDSMVTFWPTVARGEAMGGRLLGTFRTEGDTLWLTFVDLISDDNIPNPFFTSGGRVELKLVRVE